MRILHFTHLTLINHHRIPPLLVPINLFTTLISTNTFLFKPHSKKTFLSHNQTCSLPFTHKIISSVCTNTVPFYFSLSIVNNWKFYYAQFCNEHEKLHIPSTILIPLFSLSYKVSQNQLKISPVQYLFPEKEVLHKVFNTEIIFSERQKSPSITATQLEASAYITKNIGLWLHHS